MRNLLLSLLLSAAPAALRATPAETPRTCFDAYPIFNAQAAHGWQEPFETAALWSARNENATEAEARRKGDWYAEGFARFFNPLWVSPIVQQLPPERAEAVRDQLLNIASLSEEQQAALSAELREAVRASAPKIDEAMEQIMEARIRGRAPDDSSNGFMAALIEAAEIDKGLDALWFVRTEGLRQELREHHELWTREFSQFLGGSDPARPPLDFSDPVITPRAREVVTAKAQLFPNAIRDRLSVLQRFKGRLNSRRNGLREIGVENVELKYDMPEEPGVLPVLSVTMDVPQSISPEDAEDVVREMYPEFDTARLHVRFRHVPGSRRSARRLRRLKRAMEARDKQNLWGLVFDPSIHEVAKERFPEVWRRNRDAIKDFLTEAGVRWSPELRYLVVSAVPVNEPKSGDSYLEYHVEVLSQDKPVLTFPLRAHWNGGLSLGDPPAS